METEIYEVRVPIAKDTELLVYCFSCVCVLYEVARIDYQTLTAADARAMDHWDAFSRQHLIMIANLATKETITITNQGKFRVISTHD